jgi:hypothetical protein
MSDAKKSNISVFYPSKCTNVISKHQLNKTRGSALSWACVAHLSFCSEET